MQAIRTRYIGPTNTRGSRIQAKCEAKTIYVSYDHALNTAENHMAACRKLADSLEWGKGPYNTMHGGSFGNDTYWVFSTPWTKLELMK